MNALETKAVASMNKVVLPELVKGETCNLHVVLRAFIRDYHDALLKQGVIGRLSLGG